jgi:hypothetical protein
VSKTSALACAVKLALDVGPVHILQVTTYEIASADGNDFIVMEYVPGNTLDTVIPRQEMRLGPIIAGSDMKLTRITVRPDVCAGKPCIRDLRLPVSWLPELKEV